MVRADTLKMLAVMYCCAEAQPQNPYPIYSLQMANDMTVRCVNYTLTDTIQKLKTSQALIHMTSWGPQAPAS